MRIIAGKYRGRKLKSPPSLNVRPTSDRLRETLFNIISPQIEGTRFLDLCAGSGAIGIEALSRDAIHVTFVDRERKMCQLIKANLELCRSSEGQTAVVQSDALEFLHQATASNNRGSRRNRREVRPWGLAFYDPPYDTNYIPVLELFGVQASKLLKVDGLLIVEHHHKNSLPAQFAGLIQQRVVKQGESALSFYLLNIDRTPSNPGNLPPLY